MNALVFALAALQVTLGAPQIVTEIDAGKLKGDLVRLAWSDDGSQLYVQTIERDRSGAPKAIHHVIVASAAHSVKEAGGEPPWAASYWSWKAGQASPAAAAFRIAVDERTELKRSVSAPAGGAMARGAAVDPTLGTTVADVASAADTSQTMRIFALKVKGETIGEWMNEPVTPGINFSWAPAPLRLLAYAKREGGPIVVLDDTGARQELSGTGPALLPAWSPDGRRIAWLERKDKKKVSLNVADIFVQ